METVTNVSQQGTVVWMRTSAGANRSVHGKLVGFGSKGVVVERGPDYYVYGANGIKVESFPASKWSEKRWSYTDYCR